MSGQQSGKLSEADPALAVAFLRRAHPFKTAQAASAKTGIPADTIRKWFEGSKPSYLHFLRLICAYGPEFLVAVLPNPPAWLDEARGWERQRQLEASIARQADELQRIREARA